MSGAIVSRLWWMLRHWLGHTNVAVLNGGELDGRRLDAVVVQILENPISLWGAILGPYRRLGRVAAIKIEQLGYGEHIGEANQHALVLL